MLTFGVFDLKKVKNSIKRILCAAILLMCITTACSSAYAAETGRITDICVLTGRLYYCDWNTGRVVMKSVEPLVKNDASWEVAKTMEYLEVPMVRDAIFLSDGTKADYDWLNNYVDDKVIFVAARQENGVVSILHFKFE